MPKKKGRKKLIQMTGVSAQIELQHSRAFLVGMIFLVVKSWSMVVIVVYMSLTGGEVIVLRPENVKRNLLAGLIPPMPTKLLRWFD